MAKPKLALIPAAQGSKLYSVLPSNGVGDFDFTRGSAATRVNKDGLIETVASGVSRLNYPLIDGYVNGCPSHILEPVKQNVLQRSEEFDNAYWINNGVTINANQTISPSGDFSADLLTGVSGGFGVIRFSTWSATNKVASCFAKKGSSNLFSIANASGIGGVTFNLENGTIPSITSGFEGSIENYGNGWYRCTAIDTLGRSGTFSLGVTAASESVYIWGAQLEIGTYSTSYIPTTSAISTRSAETSNNSGNAETFNSLEGVVYLEAKVFSFVNYNRFSLSDSSVTNTIIIQSNQSNSYTVYVLNSSGTQYTATYNVANILDFNKIALKYKENDFSLWVNGVKANEQIGSGTTYSAGVLSELGFDSGNGSYPFEGAIKEIQYFDSVLNDTELQALTTL